MVATATASLSLRGADKKSPLDWASIARRWIHYGVAISSIMTHLLHIFGHSASGFPEPQHSQDAPARDPLSKLSSILARFLDDCRSRFLRLNSQSVRSF